MTIRKFKCTVTRTDEYVIELDENILNEEWMEHFRSYMCDYNTLEEHAENIAQFQARFGEHTFLEGYGNVTRNGKLPFSFEDYDEKGNILPEDQQRKPAAGININILSEDNACDVDVEEITEDISRNNHE